MYEVAVRLVPAALALLGNPTIDPPPVPLTSITTPSPRPPLVSTQRAMFLPMRLSSAKLRSALTSNAR